MNGSQYAAGGTMGPVTAGMTVTVSYTPGRVTFAYSNGRTATANWSSTSGDACPALAARAIGWKFEGHWLQYSGSTYVPRATTTSAVKYVSILLLLLIFLLIRPHSFLYSSSSLLLRLRVVFALSFFFFLFLCLF